MSKRIVLARIKKNQTYTVVELASVSNVSEPTVRRWITAGMETIDTQRPTLVLGEAALEFLKERQSQAKVPMKLHELYCMRCKAPRAPYGLLADYTPKSSQSGRLAALCGVCECVCNRNISISQLPELQRRLEIVIRGTE